MYENYPFIPYVGYKDENMKTPLYISAQVQSFKPGIESLMNPLPLFDNIEYKPSGKLQNKVAIISVVYF